MTRYLFTSHDGYGLGHVRRNVVLARAVLANDPTAEVAIVTGVRARPRWLDDRRLRVIPVPPLTKDDGGAYTAGAGGRDGVSAVLAARRVQFLRTVTTWRPDVVVVDRHPLGVAGELTDGLTLARAAGARLVLGLRDILDDSAAVRSELAGSAWACVPSLFDDVIVYGDRQLCDHEREYGLPVTPRYVGWVVEQPFGVEDRCSTPVADGRSVVVAAGGGGDGAAVYGLGRALAVSCPDRRVIALVGPHAAQHLLDGPAPANLVLHRPPGSCLPLYERAGAVVQMAGYNSTVEALVAGHRPILVPRLLPRREQAIRAARLAALGLADVVDEHADPAEVAWLLARPRRLPAGTLAAAGLRVDGAARVASLLAPAAAVAA